MKNNGPKILIVFFALIILAGSVLGDFNYISNNVANNYSAGEKIRGTFRIDFDNEPADSLFTSNFLGNISLLDFLEAHNNLEKGNDYNCTTLNCMPAYETGSQTSGFSISSGQEKIAGFKLNGQNVQVTSAKFEVQSNAGASCTNQLSIDVLDDGEDLIINNNHNGESCGIPYTGCYNQANTGEATILSDRKFCEKITMPSAPAFIVGGEIRNGTSNTNVQMSLYDYETTNQLGSCTLPKHSQDVQELSCIINYSSAETKDYFVCVTSSSNANFKIGWETDSPRCGTVLGGTGSGFSLLDNDFDIFAETVKFKASPKLNITDAFYNSRFNIMLKDAINDFIDDNYGGGCQGGGCVIPVSLFGNLQTFQFLNINLGYESSGVPSTVSTLYESSLQPSLIDAENLSLDVEKANFTIPLTSNANKFELRLDGQEIFEKSITIRRSFLFDVNPKVVPFGQNTLFTVSTNRSITGSVWNFGDGSAVQNSNSSQARHTYLQPNATYFDINVTAYSTGGVSGTRTFRIFVGNPRDIANSTIRDYRTRLGRLNTLINNYPSWIKLKLEDIISLNNMNASLRAIEDDYANAVTEDDFRTVMLDLIELKVPRNITSTKIGNAFPLSVGADSVNVDYIARISNEEVSDDDELRNRIVGWMGANFNSEISFEHISAVYDSDSEVLLSRFKIETKPIGEISDTSYLIFGQDVESSGGFKESYNQRSISGLDTDYAELNPRSNQVFEFFIEGEISPESLGAYISKEVDKYDLAAIEGECNLDNVCNENEDENSCPEDCSKKWLTFSIISWVVLVILAFIAYIILQEWYKRNYQRKLFPNENDLYNLVNFIYNARKSGLNEDKIKGKLRQSQWSNEKINYAFKKIDGKRLMFEIPLFKGKDNRKVITEIAARQPGYVDARFIRKGFY